MPATRPPYHPEFRAQAVQLVKDSGKTLRQIAGDLGVCYDWRSTVSRHKWATSGITKLL